MEEKKYGDEKNCLTTRSLKFGCEQKNTCARFSAKTKSISRE